MKSFSIYNEIYNVNVLFPNITINDVFKFQFLLVLILYFSHNKDIAENLIPNADI